MTNSFDKAIEMMSEAGTVAIFMHVNPDPDCVGSALALCLFLRKKGKKAFVFTPDTRTTHMIPEKIKFLPHFDLLNKCNEVIFDLSIAVDLGETGRIGDFALPLFYKGERSLVIDHHETFSDFAEYTVRDEKASSTAEILTQLLFQYDESAIDKDIACNLYAGLVTDCGNFFYECTSKKTFEVAASLIEFGIDITDITRRLTKDIDYNVYKLKIKVLSEARFFFDNKMAVIVFRKKDFMDTATNEKDTDGIINEVQNISGVLLSVSIAEVGTDRYKISFRSKGSVSAKECAEYFGGGGHFNASGCRLSGAFDDVLNRLVSVGKSRLQYV